LSQEHDKGSPFDDTLTGNASVNFIWGMAGHDQISGLGSTDWLIGDDNGLTSASGSDEISGGDGDDVITGDAGPDELSGDAGDDEIHAENGVTDAVNCGSGASDDAYVDAAELFIVGCEVLH
jgi:Ca2+-binding RTX toxin-like protein